MGGGTGWRGYSRVYELATENRALRYVGAGTVYRYPKDQ